MKRSVCLILALLFTLSGCAQSSPPSSPQGDAAASFLVCQAEYPAMPPYPDESAFFDEKTGEFDSEGFMAVYEPWQEYQRARRQQPGGYTDGLNAFFAAGSRQFLSDESDKNQIFSPLNVYMALSMLAELTDGSSRQQVLSLLGCDSMETLHTRIEALWNANYRNDGATTSILANSLWLNQDISFVPETMQNLSDIYYASSYQGEMGSEAFNQTLQNWLSQQTDGLLDDQISSIELDAMTILALASTISFQARWSHEFSQRATSPDVFHAPGGDRPCDFMHQSSSRSYFWADRFSAVSQSFNDGGAMWFFLPDEGVSTQELLTGNDLFALLQNPGSWEGQKFLTVNLSVPKFDVSSQMDLIPALKALGITDVFNPDVSDFSPMTSDVENIFLSKVLHGSRVTIDEEGCTAAAYTVMAMAGSSMPPAEEVDFTLNRPFLFVITGAGAAPLFVGTVNHVS